MGWDLCAGLFYEHRFAMLIKVYHAKKGVLGILGPGQLGPGELVPGQLGPGQLGSRS